LLLRVAGCTLHIAIAVALLHGCVDMRQPLKIGQWKREWKWQGNANGNGNRNENRLIQLRAGIPIVPKCLSAIGIANDLDFGCGFRVSLISNWSNLARRKNR